MNRSSELIVIAVALAIYGLYAASYVPAMLVGPPVPLLLIGFGLQAVLAIAASIGVWRAASWAPGVLMLLGIAVAGTWLAEAFILGIVAYLRALMVAVVALVVTFTLAAYANHRMA